MVCISGDGAEVEATWSFDLAEAVWSEDWSFHGSPLCAEDACLEQSQALALVSLEDMASTDCVQQAEALTA